MNYAFFKRKSLIACLHLVFLLLLQYSALSQQVISSGGTFFSNSNGSLSYTIGEPAIQTVSNNSNIFTQGFQQPFLIVNPVENLSSFSIECLVYPNPTQDYIILKINSDRLSGLRYILYDPQGRIIQQNRITEKETTISFENLVPAEYTLKLRSGKNLSRTFQIIKSL